MGLAFELDRVKPIPLSYEGGRPKVSGQSEQNNKLKGGRFCLFALLELDIVFCHWAQIYSSSQAFGFELHHLLYWVSSLQTADCGISQPP